VLREKDDPLPVGRGSVSALCEIEGLPGHDGITTDCNVREWGGRLVSLAGFAALFLVVLVGKVDRVFRPTLGLDDIVGTLLTFESAEKGRSASCRSRLGVGALPDQKLPGVRRYSGV